MPSGPAMAPPHASLPAIAKPCHGDRFDVWNSSSSGHQMAKDRMADSSGWRKSRSMRLNHQYQSGGTGADRIIDCAGAGSSGWDKGSKALTNTGVEVRARTSVVDMLFLKCPVVSNQEPGAPKRLQVTSPHQSNAEVAERTTSGSAIFAGCIIYLNGSTQPIISDHKLKQVLAENGAELSIHLGRRQVTHVILGKPCDFRATGVGAGGGMAASKTEGEIRKFQGCGVKYVGAEWVLESLRRGIRQPEARFANLKVAPRRQRSVYDMSKQGRRHL